MVVKELVEYRDARLNGVKIYDRVKVRTAAVIDGKVYETFEDSYVETQGYHAASNIQVGMFGRLIKRLSDKGYFYVVPRTSLKEKARKTLVGDFHEYDGVSLSSINRPLSRLFKSKYERCSIERWANPFALITDGFRSINTFLYHMPTVQLSQARLEMFHKSKLPVKGFGYELFGVPAITLFIDKTGNEDFLKEVTGLPLSFEGDGFIVSDDFVNDINVVTDSALVKLPRTFKMQGLARSKGIVIGRIKRNVEIEVKGRRFKVDVIMNTQGKRRNKAATLTLSGLRLAKYLGFEVPEIDTTDQASQEKIRDSVPYVKGKVYVDGQFVGEAVVGIAKYYIDLTHNMEPKLDSSRMFYIQTREVMDVTGFDYSMYEHRTREEILDRTERNIGLLDIILSWGEEDDSDGKHGKVDRQQSYENTLQTH